jgi:putative DNA primase/helicase
MIAHANGSAATDAAEVALSYLERGWQPIPLPPRSKVPQGNAWQALRIGEAEVPRRFRNGCNIGVLNGEPSGGLVDVDLDHSLAVALADKHLPRTNSEFGRAGKRRSHRYYVVSGPIETTHFRLPEVDGKKPMVVEIRSTGSQTVFPGSVHDETGEAIEWESDGEPATIDPDDLLAAVKSLYDDVVQQLGMTPKAAKNTSGASATTETNGAPRGGVDPIDRARKYLAKVPPAVSGQGGHDQTFHAACVLVQGFALDRAPALVLLQEWNLTCQPPWADHELEHKIDDALKADGERGHLLNDSRSSGDSPAGDSTPGRIPLTDLGNAERFVAQHGAKVRFVYQWSKWLVWSGKRWEIDDSGAVMRLAKRTTKSIYSEAAKSVKSEDADKVAAWAKSSQSPARLEAMVELAKSELPIPISHEALDADPWLWNFENGTVDLRSGKLQPHDRGDLLTKSTGIDFPTEPGEDTPLFSEYLGTTFANDQELIGYQQRLMGAAAVGAQIEHICPIFYGTGANGKSVYTSTMQAVFGDYAMQAPPGLLMTQKGDRHPTELADLFGKRLVIISETRDGQRLDEGLVKSVTGGDKIRARRMREDHWEYFPSHLPVVVTNHRPIVRGNDHGIWRRLRLVPFTVTIPPEKQNKKLTTELRAELPGIAKWVVEGCRKWQADGLTARTGRAATRIASATTAIRCAPRRRGLRR